MHVLKASCVMASTMKAWRLGAYGADGDVAAAIASLKQESIPVPAPGAGQVRIKISYAAVNPIDWKLFSGGLDGVCPCTFPYTPGFDIAGTVDAVGDGVTTLAVGDAVIADLGLVETCCKPPPAAGCGGAFAEYAVAPVGIVAKSGDLPQENAVGLPLAGLTSYQALFTGSASSFAGGKLGSLAPGQKLLVLGGSSATGMYAIQLAKNKGCHVAATASSNPMPDGTSKLDFVKGLADEVIDYKNADWSDALAGKDFDMIYDTVGDDADFAKAPKVLKKGADFISIANFNPETTSTDDVRFAVFLLKSDASDLATLVKMVQDGSLKVYADTVYSFDDVPAALTKSMSFRSGGKLVIKVS